jgi:hypothetical protein
MDGVRRKNNRDEIVGAFLRKKVWSEKSLSQSKGTMTGRGRVRVEKQAVEGKDPPSGGQSKYVRDKRRCVGMRKGSHGMVVIELLCFWWLSPFFGMCKKGLPALV